MSRKQPKIEVDVDTDHGGWWWRLVAGNGETECHSQTFAGSSNDSRRSALRSAHRMAARIEGGCKVRVYDLASLRFIDAPAPAPDSREFMRAINRAFEEGRVVTAPLAELEELAAGLRKAGYKVRRQWPTATITDDRGRRFMLVPRTIS